MFLARRLNEDGRAVKDRSLLLLALDWAKAFDSISPDRLVHALRLFGLPQKVLDVIQAIYANRIFYVNDAGHNSGHHEQHFGICQGCPLSPFLFGMVMTILIRDAKAEFAACQSPQDMPSTLVRELLYADDTLLVGTDSDRIQEYMHFVAEQGSVYGLSFNWSKLEVMPLNCQCFIPTPDGQFVKQKQQVVYLGSVLCADGSAASELNRRIGAARQVFNKLCQVGRHAKITQRRKLEIFNACVISKLTYNLHAIWLKSAERRHLDAFHVRCLRKIMKIPHAYLSHVTNQEVLRQARTHSISVTILERQIAIHGESRQTTLNRHTSTECFR